LQKFIALIQRAKNIIHTVYPISDAAFSKLEPLLTLEQYSKNNGFIRKGKRNDKEYFLLSGVVKSYLINPEGQEVTISFFTENSVLSPNSIRTSSQISSLYFKALTDIELASVDAKQFENLMIEVLEIRNFANTVLQNELLAKIDKEIGLASLSAKDRLLHFRNKYPLLENIIPHPDIASYLGITNISLSRLRRDLLG